VCVLYVLQGCLGPCACCWPRQLLFLQSVIKAPATLYMLLLLNSKLYSSSASYEIHVQPCDSHSAEGSS
jgi:hypothetical protein